MLVVVGATLSVPEVVLEPDHAPEAVHVVVSPEDQVSVLLPPESIELGLADNETVGVLSTVIVADCAAVPPVPEHVRV